MSIPKLEKTGSVYSFRYKCEKAFYIGETQRRLTTGIAEHNQPSHGSAVSNIFIHEKDELYQSFGNLLLN